MLLFPLLVIAANLFGVWFMNYIIVVFRSRNQTARMFDVFRSYGINCDIINTPRQANVGCGLSLRISENDLYNARVVVNKHPQSSFVGFFKVYANGKIFLLKRV